MEGEEDDGWGADDLRARRKKKRKPGFEQQAVRNVEVYDGMTARRLATLLEEDYGRLRAMLLDALPAPPPGRALRVPADIAQLVVLERGHTPVRVQPPVLDAVPRPPLENKAGLPRRPPVVTIMGHVDHGKTTLLDSLRKSSVAASEAGGITQHIGAFSVALPTGESVTFLDTPGHEAFAAMRSRGAHATDIVILVVAADDGIMQQTRESIAHARTAGVPMVVAISKIDKQNANVARVKQQLIESGIQLEDAGGDVQAVAISAQKGEGLTQLIEAVSLQADLLGLRGDASGPAEGVVIESHIDRARGVLVTALVKRGTLRVGDHIVSGTVWGRVRSLCGPGGSAVSEGRPSDPVEIIGLKELPALGDSVLVVESEERAKAVAALRQTWVDEEEAGVAAAAQEKIASAGKAERAEGRFALRSMSRRDARIARTAFHGRVVDAADAVDGTPPTLTLLLKTDVKGSLEALLPCVEALPQTKVRVEVVDAEVGPVTPADVKFAAATGAEIIAFNVAVPRLVESQARAEGVTISDHNIIYALLDSLREKMAALLPPLKEKRVVSRAEVLAVFSKNKQEGGVGGCRVVNGPLVRRLPVQVVRAGVVIHDGKIDSLRQVKETVDSVQTGAECGVGVERFFDFAVGDVVQNYEVIETRQSIE